MNATARLPAALLALSLLLTAGQAQAAGKGAPPPQAAPRPQAATAPDQLPRMEFLGKFSAGVPGAGIYKLFDRTDGVLCYALMPDRHLSQETPSGLAYSANGLGSISCLKVRY